MSVLRKAVKRFHFSIKEIIAIYILVFTVSPYIQQFTSRFLTTYFYMLITVVTVMYIIVNCRLQYIKELFSLLLPFVLFQLLNMAISDMSNMLLVGYQVLLFMLPICLGFYFITNNVNIKLYAVSIIMVYAVTSVTTIIGCINNSNAARLLATTATSQDATAVSFNWQNIGGFSFTYSCVLLYPLVIIAFKKKKLRLPFAVLFAAGAIALCVYTEYTIALMLVIFSSLFFFLPRDLTPKKFFMYSVIGIVFVLVFSSVLASLMNIIGELIDNPTMGEKMTAVFGGREAMDNLEDRRMDRYMKSVEIFLTHPLFGCFIEGQTLVGGHSFILDLLARFGLVGGAVLVWMYRSIYKVFYKPLANSQDYGFVVWVFIQPIILSLLNTNMWTEVLCMFSPCILIYIYGVDTVNEGALDRQHVIRTYKPNALSKKNKRSVDERAVKQLIENQ